MNLIGVQQEIGVLRTIHSRKIRRSYSVNKQYDLLDSYFFNLLITDFEARVMRLNDSGGSAKHDSALYSKVIFKERNSA